MIQISDSLIRVGLEPSLHKYESTCAICLSNFEPNDSICQLECTYKHIFHRQCLDLWLQKQNESCPICRDPITKQYNLVATK